MKIKRLLIVCIGLCCTAALRGQHVAQTRHFDSSQLQDWREQRAFQYQRNIVPELGLWDRFLLWIMRLWDNMMSTRQGVASFWTIVITLSVAIIIFFIIKYKGKASGMWSKSDKDDLKLDPLAEENIHEIDFEEKIAQALNAGKYRQAIRLRYLYLLKQLDDKSVIRWQAGKTNNDYTLEVRSNASEDSYTVFRQLSIAFDFAWYGEYDATAEDYNHVKTLFDQMSSHSFTTLKATENERI